MTTYYVYTNTTGEILRTGSVSQSDISIQAGTGETAVEASANDLLQRHDIATDTLVNKTQQSLSATKSTITADGVDESVITCIAGSIAKIHDESYVVDDGTLEFSVDLVGSYVITFTHTLYLDTEITIEAES